MPARTDIDSILIIGSGPIVIGQACEFDYSGTQAVQALKEEGYTIILVNPNPATVMTTPGIADSIYMEPLSVEYVEQIIRKERPDAILTTMGGQTGLNLTLELAKAGILERYGVEVIGAGIESIRLAEDRGAFKEVVESLGLFSPDSCLADSLEKALAFKAKSGLPLIIRPSYTLGGMGGSIAEREEDFIPLVTKALQASPSGEALIEESLIGWKEFELEVMRDRQDNAIIVCSIENIDPMGIHTGDSITVAPIQTLSDTEYQHMRNAAIDILRAVGVDCGGSNVQFAMKPDSDKLVVIEMNPRVSRSSALASKATGFPIARCSAKLAVGYTLDEVTNEITGVTASCFEPALDYCAVKVPRFELEKFPMAYSALGTQMKSVGETLAIGRTLNEALNKAIRATERSYEGLEPLTGYAAEEIERILCSAHPLRIFAIYTTLTEQGTAAVEAIGKKTGYDRWFLYQMLRQIELEKTIRNSFGDTAEQYSLLLDAKRMGFSDLHIARLTGLPAKEIEALRETHAITPSYHLVDTCAGEFKAQTPYFYSTYGEIDEGESLKDDGIIILASGPNRIGQGLEFDTCCTLASKAYQRYGSKTILINSNPETVSTDFNTSDRLYLEPLTYEHVVAIMKKEQVPRVVVQLGGQTPLNLAEKLQEAGAEIIGTSIESINDAEDRGKFSALIQKLGLRQPENQMAGSHEAIRRAAHQIGFPVLLRPSFVLGGRSMFIAYNDEELEEFLTKGIEVSQKAPVLVDQFLEDAFEYDLDAIADGYHVYIGGIMQHIEAAGVHSGDSACVFPPYKSQPEILAEMKHAAVAIARETHIHGFLNIQFAQKDDKLYVLEVNPRASRTIPFLSKNSSVNLIDAVVRSWMGTDLNEQGLVGEDGIGEGYCTTGWAVKEAVFSFDRFTDIDPVLGPEMRSTGEVQGSGSSFAEAFYKSQIGAGNRLPKKGKVFISVNKRDRTTIIPIARKFEALGFTITATRGTARDLFDEGILCEVILKVHEGHPNIIDNIRNNRVDLVINTPMGFMAKKSDDDIRTEAMRMKIPYTTTMSAAEAAVGAIAYQMSSEPQVLPLPPYRQ
ncbi:MAG: carbamoyl-phosphate synthase large subunit [Spirochaetia bacterium]|nr:carbamoyl-phosphate synthase large subunit [Spirochaetia bacterium]